MQIRGHIPLCDEHRLFAVLDELTLTYAVVERGPGGETRTVRRHLSSLREARAWARACRERQAAPR
jgi:hypothetical protein